MELTEIACFHGDVHLHFRAHKMAELRPKIAAYEELFGDSELRVYGDVDTTEGDAAFLRYPGDPIVSIGQKFATVDIGDEGTFRFDPSKQRSLDGNVRYILKRARTW